MKAETAKKVEEMKAQTFATEIEMYGISREKAARTAAEYFGTGCAENTARADGYRTWSAWDLDERCWKFKRDASIDIEGDEKCELVSPILCYDDMELLQGLVRALRHAGAKSDGDHRCGIHVHIGATGHTAQTLRNLVNLMASHEDLLIESLCVSPVRTEEYCRTVDPEFLAEMNRIKPVSIPEVSHIWYTTHGASGPSSAHYHPSRYSQLNLHSFFTKGTIEFRLFEFRAPDGNRQNGLHAGELKAFIQLCLALSQNAKTLTKVIATPSKSENKKYLMRTWLIRLGMIGDEFKTARAVLTKNLDGDTAFRNGR